MPGEVAGDLELMVPLLVRDLSGEFPAMDSAQSDVQFRICWEPLTTPNNLVFLWLPLQTTFQEMYHLK